VPRSKPKGIFTVIKKLKRLLYQFLCLHSWQVPVDTPVSVEPVASVDLVGDREEAVKTIHALSLRFNVPLIIFSNVEEAEQMLRDMRRGTVMAKRLKELGTDLPLDYLN